MARILIIDDEELVRYTVRKILDGKGHEVAEAKNGDEGMKLHRMEPFDIVITDILMPVREGLETITELRREFPAQKIIAISGGGRTGNLDYLRMAEKMGVSGILPKPFTPDDLLENVDHCLAQC